MGFFKDIATSVTAITSAASDIVVGTCEATKPLVKSVNNCTSALEVYSNEILEDANFEAKKAKHTRDKEIAAWETMLEDE